MSQGKDALLELPAETITIVRGAGLRLVPNSILGLVAALPFVVGAGFCLGVSADLARTTRRDLAVSFVADNPGAWLSISALLSVAWAISMLEPLGRFTRAPDHIFTGPKYLGLALLYFPLIAAFQLPFPDLFPRTLEDPPNVAMPVQLIGLVVAVMFALAAATTFTVAPALYLAQPSLGVRAALRRSRELAHGRRELFMTVSALPFVLATAGVVSLALGEKLTLGAQILGHAVAQRSAFVAGVACVAVTPLLSAAMKTAALNIATRPD